MRALALAALLLSAPASAEEAPVDGPWVAVRYGAAFHGGGATASETLAEHPEFRAPTRMRLLDEALPEQGRVRVAVAARDRGHCLGEGPLPRGWEVELEVDVADLVAVTTQPMARSFDDGSGFELPAGVPLDAAAQPRVGRLVLPFAADEGRRGRVWTSAPRSGPRAKIAGRVPRSAPIAVGGEPVALHTERATISHHGVTSADGALLTVFDTSCGVVRARVGETPEVDDDGGGLGGLIGGGGSDDRSRLTEGPLFWPDGSAAGRLTQSRVYDTEEVRWEGDDLRCVVVPLDQRFTREHGLQFGQGLRLCVPEERVEAVETVKYVPKKKRKGRRPAPLPKR